MYPQTFLEMQKMFIPTGNTAYIMELRDDDKNVESLRVYNKNLRIQMYSRNRF